MEAVRQPVLAGGRHRTRRRRRLRARARRLLTVLLLAAALVTVPRVVSTLSSTPEVPAIIHVVAEGETLWEIADRYTDGQDLRQVVAAIQKYNGLTSPVIRPGQVLEIPPSLHR
ncbi:MAG TPA: LysM peptidoglycan-binding domain-containing protein [Symbiobacteriaceae bacterium]